MEKNIITGGPCTGKTTLLNKLHERGYQTIPEAARSVIEAEQKKANENPLYKPTLPWTDLQGFQDLIIEEQSRLERTVNKPIAFLDRSCIDNIAYAELGGFRIDDKVKHYLANANYGKVFFLDQLNIYENDAIRKEDREEAITIQNKLYEVYQRFDYEIIKVPDIGKDNRVELVLRNINKYEKTEAGVLVPTYS